MITTDYLAEPEVRVTDESTGGQKGAKLTQVGALDPVSLIEVARVAGMGANKYSAYNFMKGMDWSLMFNAAMRHLLRMWAGEDRDPESGQLHMAHAAWLCMALVSYQLRELGTDDRPTPLADEPDPRPVGVTFLGFELTDPLPVGATFSEAELDALVFGDTPFGPLTGDTDHDVIRTEQWGAGDGPVYQDGRCALCYRPLDDHSIGCYFYGD